MAVRPFDFSERQATPFVPIGAPRTRREARRLRQRWMAIGVASLSVPFVVAVAIIFGVSH